MEWSALYDAGNQPSLKDIDAYISNKLWREMNAFLQQSYNVEPETAYSQCSGQPGWNVKYRNGGKSLCTLYPMPGYFIALVVIGSREEPQAELLMPTCSGYTQQLFGEVPFSAGGKWLMINVTDAVILEDVKKLIKLRVKPG